MDGVRAEVATLSIVFVEAFFIETKLVRLRLLVRVGSNGERDTLKKQLLPLPTELPPLPSVNVMMHERLVATPAVTFVDSGEGVIEAKTFAAKAR